MTILQIEPHDIDTCTMERLLRKWHADFHALADELTSEVHAAKVTGAYDHRLFGEERRGISACYTAMKRIERRVIALGCEPIVTRDGKERGIIKKLRAENEALRAMLGEGRVAA